MREQLFAIGEHLGEPSSEYGFETYVFTGHGPQKSKGNQEVRTPQKHQLSADDEEGEAAVAPRRLFYY